MTKKESFSVPISVVLRYWRSCCLCFWSNSYRRKCRYYLTI